MSKSVIFLAKKMEVVALFITVLIGCTSQPEISQWRGDNRDGIYNETELLDLWPEDGPELLWSAEGLGIGYAAPVITENKIFVNGTIDSVSHLFAFDLRGGRRPLQYSGLL